MVLCASLCGGELHWRFQLRHSAHHRAAATVGASFARVFTCISTAAAFATCALVTAVVTGSAAAPYCSCGRPCICACARPLRPHNPHRPSGHAAPQQAFSVAATAFSVAATALAPFTVSEQPTDPVTCTAPTDAATSTARGCLARAHAHHCRLNEFRLRLELMRARPLH